MTLSQDHSYNSRLDVNNLIIFLRNRNRKNRFTKSKDNEMQEGKFSFITWCVLYVCKFHHDSSS